MSVQVMDERAAAATQFWLLGDEARQAGEIGRAYLFYTEAHDLVTGCPRLHIQAHRRLRAINRLRGNWGEYCTDTILLALAPFGIFEVITLILRSRVGAAGLCRRND